MLNPNAVIPLYKQLMNKLKAEIASGVYKSGDKLLPEVEMAKQNNISVITVRRVINELTVLGFVEKKQGKGTFVAVKKYDRDYTQITGFSEACKVMGLVPGSRLLESKLMVPSENILDSLKLPAESQTVYISRLRYVNGEPMAIETSYFSLNYAFLLNETLEGSLFDVLKEKTNIRVAKSQKMIEIYRANAQEAKYLGLRKNNPLLLVHSTAYTEDGVPVYVCNQIINGERFKLMV